MHAITIHRLEGIMTIHECVAPNLHSSIRLYHGHEAAEPGLGILFIPSNTRSIQAATGDK